MTHPNYKVIEKPTAEELEKEVNIWIEQGFRPLGVVSVCTYGENHSEFKFVQTLIMKEL